MHREHLFVYGTLTDPAIQASVIGRVVQGEADTLPGFSKTIKRYQDGSFPVIVPDVQGRVDGLILSLLPEELLFCDLYEGRDYHRIMVKLHSGREAWVFL